MKHIFGFLFFLMVFTPTISFGQMQNNVQDGGHKMKMYFDSTASTFYSIPNFTTVLKFNSTGEVFDQNNDKICTVESDGDIKDVNGDKIGEYKNSNGKVYDINGAHIGTVGTNGEVTDVGGAVLGFLNGYIPKGIIAYYFFFSGLNL